MSRILHFDESWAENVKLDDSGRAVEYACLGGPHHPNDQAALAARIENLTGQRVRFGEWITLQGDPRDGGAEVPLMPAEGVVFDTERLTLREFTAADVDHMIALNANPNVMRYLHEPPLTTREQALAILTERIFPQYRDHGVGRWAVETRADGRFIGWCGLKLELPQRIYDIGYRFVEPAWRHGYATEAARATLAWGRIRFPGATIIGRAMPENRGSIRVLEKIGLHFQRAAEEDGVPIHIYG